ncbi:MAG: hypothetical protein HKN73_13575 [Gemmatimonadetes bacterium]|nr:hypothetical protein [Gemmatimonadota bacterium]
MSDGAWRRGAARAWLRTAFDDGEIEEILTDVDELAGDRPGLRGLAVRAAMIARYPLLELRDRIHGNMTSGGARMMQMGEDMRLVARRLFRRPGFPLTSMAILALGLGAIIAVHSVVKGVLLDPLPMGEPDRLVALTMIDADGQRHRMTPGNVRDVAALNDVFSHVAAFGRSEVAFHTRDGGPPTVLRGGAVTPGYLATLGLEPVLGRAFVEADADPNTEPVVILSHHVWEQYFGSDPDVIGRSIDLGDNAWRVVGVAPPSLYPTSATVGGELPFSEADQDFFRPLRYGGDYWSLRRPHLLGGLARLAPGMTPQSATAALETLSTRLQAEYSENRNEQIVFTPLTEVVVGDVRPALLVLLLSVFLVFAIAAVNVGSLFLIREEDRQSERTVARTLGATPLRLLSQRILEASLICGSALVLGSVLSAGFIDVMQALVPYRIPRLADVTVDAQALGLGGLLSLVLAFVFGGASRALGSARGTALARARVTRPSSGRLQSLLIASQSALAVVVLVSALLLTRSFQALQATDPGVRATASWTLGLHGAGYDTDLILERVRALPGVRSAAVAYNHPFERTWQDGFVLVDRPMPNGDSTSVASIRPYGDGYFDAAGIPLREGRLPDLLDHEGEVRMAVVNEAFRRRFLPEGTDRSLQIRIPSADRRLGEGNSLYRVVGVVGDVRFLGPETDPDPAIYVPLRHFSVAGYQLLIRPASPGSVQLQAVRQAVHEALPDVAVDEAGTLAELHSQALARPRFNMMLIATLSATALLLCTLGSYGIVARTMSTRRREIGIRAALGAAGAVITRGVAVRALRPMALGVVLGAGASLATSRVLQSLLFGLSPVDPISLIGGPLLLLLVSGAGALVPALRALSVDPAETLRIE